MADQGHGQKHGEVDEELFKTCHDAAHCSHLILVPQHLQAAAGPSNPSMSETSVNLFTCGQDSVEVGLYPDDKASGQENTHLVKPWMERMPVRWEISLADSTFDSFVGIGSINNRWSCGGAVLSDTTSRKSSRCRDNLRDIETSSDKGIIR